MVKKVFYTCYQPYLVDTAIRLYEEKKWEPVYWFTEEHIWGDISSELKKRFKNTIFHDYNDAIKSKWPSEANGIPMIPVDEHILNTLSRHESTSLSMLDRNDLTGEFTYNDRINTYHDHLKYWNSVLEYLKPDLILMEALPHQLCDFLIYRLAKLKGIKTLMFNSTFFLDGITTMESYETGQDEVVEGYKKLVSEYDGRSVILSEKADGFIQKFLGRYEDNLRFDVKEGLAELAHIRSDKFTKVSKEITAKLSRVLDIDKWRKKFEYIADLQKESVNSQHKKKDIPFSR